MKKGKSHIGIAKAVLFTAGVAMVILSFSVNGLPLAETLFLQAAAFLLGAGFIYIENKL